MPARRSGFLFEGLVLAAAMLAPRSTEAAVAATVPASLLRLVTMRGDVVVGVPAGPDGLARLAALLRAEGEADLWRYVRLREPSGAAHWRPQRRLRLRAEDVLMIDTLADTAPVAPLPEAG
jgi:hypothetical protein